MNGNQPNPPQTSLAGRFAERLHDPFRLRAFVTAMVLLAAYLGIYLPLSGQISDTAVALAHEQKRFQLATDVEHLRVQYQNFKDRLPQHSDSKEWVQYVLNGIRGFPLKLTALDCDPPRDMGPYKAAVIRVELEGGFFPMDGLLRWVEANPRLMRIDSVKIAPSRSNNAILLMQLTILGAMT